MAQKRPLGFDTIEENLRAWERDREKRTRQNPYNNKNSPRASSLKQLKPDSPTSNHHDHSHQFTGVHEETQYERGLLLSPIFSSSLPPRPQPRFLPSSFQNIPRTFQVQQHPIEVQPQSLSQSPASRIHNPVSPISPIVWETPGPVTWTQPITMSLYTAPSTANLRPSLKNQDSLDKQGCPSIPLHADPVPLSSTPPYIQNTREIMNTCQFFQDQSQISDSPLTHNKSPIKLDPPPQTRLQPQVHTPKQSPAKKPPKPHVLSKMETLPGPLLRELISFVDPRDLPALSATSSTLHAAVVARTHRLIALDLRGGASPQFYTACRREYLPRRSVRLICKELTSRKSSRRRRHVRALRVRPGADYKDKIPAAQIDADHQAVAELAEKLPYVRYLALDALDLTTTDFARKILSALSKDSRVAFENISIPALADLVLEPVLGKSLLKVSLRLAGPHMRAQDLILLAQHLTVTAVPKLRDFGVMFDRAFLLTCPEFVPALSKLVESVVSKRKPPLSLLRVYDFPPYLDFVPIVQLVEKYKVHGLTLYTAAPDDDSRLLSALAQLSTIDALRLVIGTCSVPFLHCPGPLWASLLHLSIDGPASMMRVPARPFQMPCLHSLVAPAPTAYSLLPHSVSPVLKELVVLNPAPGDPMPILCGPLRRAKMNLAYFPIRIPHELLPVKVMCTRAIPNKYVTSLPDSLRENALEDNDDYTLFLSHFYDSTDPDPPELIYY